MNNKIQQNQLILDKANYKIKRHYLKQKKEVIINDFINDFQEKFNYESFVEEIGLSEVFESWKVLNMLR